MHIPHFIVVSDRGVFRAGWIESLAVSQGQHRTKIRWIEELAFVSPREHLVEQVTDMSGAFRGTFPRKARDMEPRCPCGHPSCPEGFLTRSMPRSARSSAP
jgi:hypothetical protein